MLRAYSNHMRPLETRQVPRLWTTVALAVVTAAGAVASYLGRVEVKGLSMAPTLLPGDRLLVLKTRRVRPGDLVVVRDPREPSRQVVKRVTATTPNGIEIRGDNPAASTDSRTYGSVPRTLIVGRALSRYAPPPGQDPCAARTRSI